LRQRLEIPIGGQELQGVVANPAPNLKALLSCFSGYASRRKVLNREDEDLT
jgi:hypothetical protein